MNQPGNLKQAAFDSDTLKDVGVGAGGGLVVGALASLFRQRPSLKQALKDGLKGAAGGAALGVIPSFLDETTDVTGSTSQLGATEEIGSDAPSAAPAAKMNLGTAALSGLAPVIGPAIHGGKTRGTGQAIGSAMSSAAGMHAGMPWLMNGNPKTKGIGLLMALLGSAAGATGAAAVGNTR